MKKIICTVCTLLLVFAFMSPAVLPVQAAGSFNVTVSSGSAKAGKEVTLKVSATKNTGVCSVRLLLVFDADKLTPTKFTNTNSPFASKGSVILPQTSSNRFIYTFANTSAVTSTGLLMNVTFKVAADVKEGESIAVTVKEVEEGDILDENLSAVSLSVTAGSVKVPVPASSTASSKPVSSSKPTASSKPSISSKPAESSAPDVTSEEDTSTEITSVVLEETPSETLSRPLASSEAEEQEGEGRHFSVLTLILGIIVAIETGVIFYLVMALRDSRYRHNRSRRF